MGKESGTKARKVLQYSLKRELINEYPSITEASKRVNRTSVQGIWGCCNGRFAKHSGYIWEYKEEEAKAIKQIKNRTKTMSKNFFDYEIKGVLEIDGRKVIYLKDNVVRKRYFDFSDDQYAEHLNQEVVNAEKLQDFYKKILGVDDFENN